MSALDVCTASRAVLRLLCIRLFLGISPFLLAGVLLKLGGETPGSTRPAPLTVACTALWCAAHLERKVEGSALRHDVHLVIKPTVRAILPLRQRPAVGLRHRWPHNMAAGSHNSHINAMRGVVTHPSYITHFCVSYSG